MKLAKIVPIPKGAYSASATYNALDIVRYNGVSYICCVDNTTGVTPAEGDTWKIIAEDGEISGTETLYSTQDATSTDIANSDLIPFYDVSASAKKNITWEYINTRMRRYGVMYGDARLPLKDYIALTEGLMYGQAFVTKEAWDALTKPTGYQFFVPITCELRGYSDFVYTTITYSSPFGITDYDKNFYYLGYCWSGGNDATEARFTGFWIPS